MARCALSGLPAAPFFCRVAATPYPTYGLYRCELKLSTLPLSPWLLKLPVLVASKSLRRSRQAGAARM
ncbi:hypothetical protein, partial [Klebsiella aerogenes]|uniref:hypothetical protein n=1 Tax=Klebsiella aerogenes TaxID=548 RepID=UPI001D0DF4DB